ncbi:MAG: Asp-tRNA(Asn)/Glu-tRNA(Gln) amidotransferase subunit GatC [bacterium]|nr:Asp-tRNA(Asn)/Glu-tRNA(Gln) amidotransferase subunit GatC [bacterium]
MTNNKLTTQQVEHVAKLANLTLTKDEVKTFQKQLSEVLGYVEILSEVDTSKVEPTSQVTGMENVLRDDKTGKSLSQDEALSGTKNKERGCFKVKAIFEEK